MNEKPTGNIDYNPDHSIALERSRRQVISCNLKESLIALCLNGGVCWKIGVKGVTRCLCQPLFHGKNCELQKEITKLESKTTDTITIDGAESTSMTPMTSEVAKSTSKVQRSSEVMNIYDDNHHHRQPCSPSESKESGCQNNSECFKILVEGNKYKYKCRCLPPFFGSHCNLEPRRVHLGDISMSLSGFVAMSVIALSLLAIFLLLIHIATMKRTQRRHRWTGRPAHTNHHQNFKQSREPFTIFGDGPLTIPPPDLPKIIFYKNSPLQSAGNSPDPYKTNDEFAWTNNNREDRTRMEENNKKVLRFHDDKYNLRDVLFEDERGDG